jgi:hypothetical protein
LRIGCGCGSGAVAGAGSGATGARGGEQLVEEVGQRDAGGLVGDVADEHGGAPAERVDLESERSERGGVAADQHDRGTIARHRPRDPGVAGDDHSTCEACHVRAIGTADACAPSSAVTTRRACARTRP